MLRRPLPFHFRHLFLSSPASKILIIITNLLFWILSPTHLLIARSSLPSCWYGSFPTISLIGSPSFPSKTLPPPSLAQKDAHVAESLPILSANSRFAFVPPLHRSQRSSNLPSVPTQLLSQLALETCRPNSTFALTLLYSQDMAVFFVNVSAIYDMSHNLISMHALLSAGTWDKDDDYTTDPIQPPYFCLLRLPCEDTALAEYLFWVV